MLMVGFWRCGIVRVRLQRRDGDLHPCGERAAVGLRRRRSVGNLDLELDKEFHDRLLAFCRRRQCEPDCGQPAPTKTTKTRQFLPWVTPVTLWVRLGYGDGSAGLCPGLCFYGLLTCGFVVGGRGFEPLTPSASIRFGASTECCAVR